MGQDLAQSWIFSLMFFLSCIYFIVNLAAGIAGAVYAQKKGDNLWMVLSIVSIFMGLSIVVAPIAYFLSKSQRDIVYKQQLPDKFFLMTTEERYQALKELALLKLSDADPRVREYAIVSLTIRGSYGDHKGSSYLDEDENVKERLSSVFLLDPDVRVRSAAQWVLPKDKDFITNHLQEYMIMADSKDKNFGDRCLVDIASLADVTTLDFLISHIDIRSKASRDVSIAIAKIISRNFEELSEAQKQRIDALFPKVVYRDHDVHDIGVDSEGGTLKETYESLWTFSEIYDGVKLFKGDVYERNWRKPNARLI